MKAAAFFDIDGTLVPPPSLEKRFLRYLFWRGAIGWPNFARCAAPLLRETSRALFCNERAGIEFAVAQCKAYLAGVPTAAMDAWLGWLARHSIERIPEVLQRVDRHARQGHRIFLLSGTLQPLAEAVARLIPVPVMVCATQLECEDGRYTGRVLGEAVCGPAKARAMKLLAAENSLDLERSYAYGDSFADRWMLARVGHPYVVQAAQGYARRLAWLARRRGWPMLHWGAITQREQEVHFSVGERAEEHNAHSVAREAEVNNR
jgi:HAD superfamily hydrolase (TIGR01490 family)